MGHSIPNWDIPIVFAKLKTGEFVLGDGHSTKCGEIVNKKEFIKEAENIRLQLQHEVNRINELITKV